MKLNELKTLQEGFLTTVGQIKTRIISQAGFKMKSGSYTIEDGVVNVDGDVTITNIWDKQLPFKFGKVTGDFIIKECKIENLQGCPHTVEKNFEVHGCKQLKSLEGSPETVRFGYRIDKAAITNLKGSPRKIGAVYAIQNCEMLTSLEGAPDSAGTFAILGAPRLESVKYTPQEARSLSFQDTSITSLKDLNRTQLEFLYLTRCSLFNSFEGIPEHVGRIEVTGQHNIRNIVGIDNIIKSVDWLGVQFGSVTKGGLGLLNIKIGDMQKQYSDAFKIIYKYLNRPDDIFDCQQELIDAGCEGNAEL